MTYRPLNLLILFTCLSLINCSKDEEPPIPETNYSCVIQLTKDYKILNVEYYTEGMATYVKTFSYSNGLVSVNKVFNNQYFSVKSTFYLNVNSLADSCIDSSFLYHVLSDITIYRFKYDNSGYRISADKIHYSIDNDTVESTSGETVTFGVTNGNTVSDNSTGLSCSFFYDFTALENKIDLNLLLGDFNGKKNATLIKAYHSDCHISSGTALPESCYDYNIDADGWVIRSVEYHTSGYHSTDEKPIKEKHITTYKYIIK